MNEPLQPPNVPALERVHQLPTPPARPADAHKGTFGSVLIIAGSEGMSGAACLSGQAALHGGAGLVTVAIPRRIASIVAMAHSSYMTVALEEDREGRVAASALARLETAISRQTSVAVGPGLGTSTGVKQVVHHIYHNCPLPLVLDADGLNAFAGESELLNQRQNDSARILTPHPGEFSRLTGLDTASIHDNRESLAVEFARRHNLVLLLKGQLSIITDGRRIAINTTGNAALATGGSGDVLTGLIAALLAQRLPAFEAAWLAAHLHGVAGECLSAESTDRYATSQDLLTFLQAAWKQL